MFRYRDTEPSARTSVRMPPYKTKRTPATVVALQDAFWSITTKSVAPCCCQFRLPTTRLCEPSMVAIDLLTLLTATQSRGGFPLMSADSRLRVDALEDQYDLSQLECLCIMHVPYSAIVPHYRWKLCS
jgi:hypothetical protein